MLPTTTSFERPRLLALDLLRFSAAIVVALGHFSGSGATRIAPGFWMAVPLFFVLSGYVLAHAYEREIGVGKLNFRSFVIYRLARLYPLHILAFAAMCALWGFLYILHPAANFRLVGSWGQLFETLTLTHFWLGYTQSFNLPSWSISVEFWGGILVFWLCLIAPNKLVVILCATALYAFSGLLPFTLTLNDKAYYAGFAAFAWGWAIYAYKAAISTIFSRVPSVVRLGMAVTLILVIAASPMDPAKFPLMEAAIYLFIVVTVAGLSSLAPVESRILRWAGDISYGVYMWHWPLFMALPFIVSPFARAFQIPIMGTWVADFFFLTLLLVVSTVSFQKFERPTQAAIRRLSLRSR